MSVSPFERDDGSTPITEEEREGLIPSYITLRGELNEAEQANILEGEEWAFARKRNVVSLGLLNTLHQRMFGNPVPDRRKPAAVHRRGLRAVVLTAECAFPSDHRLRHLAHERCADRQARLHGPAAAQSVIAHLDATRVRGRA